MQTNAKSKFKLNSTALKFIAILAMTIDHIAWRFIDTPTVLGQALHAVGRMTIVIMSLCIVEGYIHTKNFNRYLLRLIVFAIISQPFYLFFSSPDFSNIDLLDFNVLFSLAFALISLKVYNSNLSALLKVFIITLICFCSYFCDWLFIPTVFALTFYITKDSRKKRIFAFLIIAVFSATFFIIRFMLKNSVSFHTAILYDGMMFGLLLGIIPICFYGGKLGRKNKFSKWIFYIYYPLHLFILGIITRLI